MNKNAFVRIALMWTATGLILYTNLSALSVPTTGAIATGDGFTLALKGDGTVWAWGVNDYGQLGIGTTNFTREPTPIAGLTSVAAVAAGQDRSAAIKTDGTVWVWGANWSGLLGDGTTDHRSSPFQLPHLSNVIAISISQCHTMALKADGTVWSWGHNYYGQLGDGSNVDSFSTPVQVTGLSNVIAIAAGDLRSMAVTSNGVVWAWGYNTDGMLGDGSMSDQSAPVQVLGISNVAKILSGQFSRSALALKADGTVWSWGENNSGELGDGTTSSRSTPAQIAGISNVIDIAQYGALKSDGTVWHWAFYGPGEWAHRSPEVINGLANSIAIAVNGGAALKADGSVSTWEGDGNWLTSITAVQVANLNGITSASVGREHSLIAKSDGTVWAWGANDLGQREPDSEPPDTPAFSSTPVQIGGLNNVVAVVAGGSHNVVLKNDGTVWGWGENRGGQLGDGTTTSRISPVQASGVSGIVKITASSYHTVALKDDGTVWGWGENMFGELDSGSTVNPHPTPAQLNNLANVVAVAAGEHHTVALKSDGTVWGWGYNEYGCLGDGSGVSSSTPVQALGLTGIVAISAGAYFTLALKGDGTVWGWGENYSAQLGTGDREMRLQPVQLNGLSGIVAISAGAQYSAALKSDGTVWSWGSTDMGAWPEQTAPMRVRGASEIAKLGTSAGFQMIAVRTDGTVRVWGGNSSAQLGFIPNLPSRIPIRLTTAAGDTDQDGITDSSELQYFGNLNRRGFDDGDEDGLTDIQEFDRGTDPTKANGDGDLMTDFVDPYPADFYNNTTPTFTILGGNNQFANPSAFNAQPFDVAVWNTAGTSPLANAPVNFSITQGSGLLATTNTGSPSPFSTLLVRTDTLGTAQVFFKQPATGGTLSLITATAGTATPLVFQSHSIAPGGDSDGDGMSDDWETFYGLNPAVNDANGDPDGDGLTNLQEYLLGRNPTKSAVTDTTGAVNLRVFSPLR